MTYSKIAPKEYARLRTQPEHIRQEYEQRANRALQEQVEKERKYLQKQVDDYQKYATLEIEKAWQEAEHWREQVRIIYQLLENSEKLIQEEREMYKNEVVRLKREIEILKKQKANKSKYKRLMNMD